MFYFAYWTVFSTLIKFIHEFAPKSLWSVLNSAKRFWRHPVAVSTLLRWLVNRSKWMNLTSGELFRCCWQTLITQLPPFRISDHGVFEPLVSSILQSVIVTIRVSSDYWVSACEDFLLINNSVPGGFSLSSCTAKSGGLDYTRRENNFARCELLTKS